jgi:hypothetical protein
LHSLALFSSIIEGRIVSLFRYEKHAKALSAAPLFRDGQFQRFALMRVRFASKGVLMRTNVRAI